MDQSGRTETKWIPFRKGNGPVIETVQESPEHKEKSVVGRIFDVIRILFLALYRLRGILLAVPVIFAALRLAAYNSEHLPLMVGLSLQSNGEFAQMISRQAAVSGPLMLTGVCLALTIFSRKTLYPWLISVFSLVVPILLLFTNMYPA